MKKIDIYNHFFPKAYADMVQKVAPHYQDLGKRVRNIPMLFDLDKRFECMDKFGEGYCQILTVAQPPAEVLAGPDKSPDLARAANDGLAELVDKYPTRFPGFAANLPLNNIDACIEEIHRAMKDLGALGIEIRTNAAGKPMDLPEFEEIYRIMAQEYDRPIWVHPVRPAGFSDYITEEKSKYEIWWVFGWPYETSAFMARMVFSGVFDRYPGIKFITHHLGGMVPYFEGRVGPGWDQLGTRTSDEDYFALLKQLKKRPIDYFKQFYADTAVFGGLEATKCGLSFFGEDQVMFASDSPFDPEGGEMYIRETIKILDNLDISEEKLAKIYHKNAEKLMGLDG